MIDLEKPESNVDPKENLDIEDREILEQQNRDLIAEDIDNFLASKFTFINDGPEQACNITAMQGYERGLKLSLYKAKLYKKLDKVSDDLIASCKWELNKKVVIPKSPRAYRKMVLSELDIKEDELLRLVVEDLKKRAKKVRVRKDKARMEPEEPEERDVKSMSLN